MGYGGITHKLTFYYCKGDSVPTMIPHKGTNHPHFPAGNFLALTDFRQAEDVDHVGRGGRRALGVGHGFGKAGTMAACGKPV